MTERLVLMIKMGFTGVAAMVSSALGILLPVLWLLLCAMLMDYLTGMLASVLEGAKHATKGLSSRVGVKGIFKKIMILAAVFVAVGMDWLIFELAKELGVYIPGISGSTFFGLLTGIWFLINEGISILENVTRALGEGKVPPFLLKILALIKAEVEEKAED